MENVVWFLFELALCVGLVFVIGFMVLEGISIIRDFLTEAKDD